MKKQFKLLSVLGILSSLLVSCQLKFNIASRNGGSSINKSSSQDETESSSSLAPKTFTITWKNYDGVVLEIDQKVEEGVTPTYDGPTPVKTNNAQYNYTWSGWTPEVTPAHSDTEYIASFKEELRKYTVVWKDEDGKVLETDNDVPHGTMPEYNSEEPTKESTIETSYFFNGWSPEVITVSGDAEYVATYREEVRKYTITWKNEDGTVLKTEEVPYGTVPSFGPNNPEKESTSQYPYSFNGWSPNVVAVSTEAEYTATYVRHERTFTVTWVNYDGTVLELDENVAYGANPHYDGATPTRSGSRGVSYTFKGWTPTIMPVYRDQVYTAKYTSAGNFSFDIIEYELNSGYQLSDLRGAPWINSNLPGELDKIKKPSLKDDFYASVNYDAIKNKELGPFEIDSYQLYYAMNDIFNNSKQTTNGAFIKACYQKMSSGDVSSVTSYLSSFDLSTYLSSKDIFASYSSYLDLNPIEDGYEVIFNDGYFDGDHSLYTLWFYGQWSEYSSFNNVANNIVSNLAGAFGYSLTTLETTSIRSMERTLINSENNDYQTYGESLSSFTVNTVPWTQLKSALLDAGLTSSTTIKIKDYAINSLNYLFNTYAFSQADTAKKDIMARLSFDYRFLLGVSNYKTLNQYITQAVTPTGGAVFPSESNLYKYDNSTIAKELTKLMVTAVFEQSYIELEGDDDVKNAVSEFIEEIIDGYRIIISENTWLSQTTKDNVLTKLNKMEYASCYSDRYKNFAKIDATNLNGSSLFNLYQRYYTAQTAGNVNNPIPDDTLWAWKAMPSYTVNAFYSPTDNKFAVLNGILPGFTGNCDEELYGMLGFVIGHEITHAFDSSGSLFDENGNYRDIMTDSDRSNFNNKIDKMISFYNQIMLFEGTTAGGERINTEATADMGGIKVMLQLAKSNPEFNYDLFFKSAAITWCSQPYSDYEVEQRLDDSHPFAYLRTNVTLAQFEEFVTTYGLEPGDGMYIPENQRVKIW